MTSEYRKKWKKEWKEIRKLGPDEQTMGEFYDEIEKFIDSLLKSQRKEDYEDGYAEGLLDGKKTHDEMMKEIKDWIMKTAITAKITPSNRDVVDARALLDLLKNL